MRKFPHVPLIDPPVQTIRVNENAQINCWLPEHPYATLRWFRLDGVLSADAKDSGGGSLRIPRVKVSDEGSYVCATDDLHPAKVPKVLEHSKVFGVTRDTKVPEIREASKLLVVDPLHQTVQANERAQIRCWSSSRPYAMLRWLKEDGKISENAADHDGLLTIPRAAPSDEGVYICSSNDIHPGHTIYSVPAILHVESQAVLEIDRPQQTVTVNETAQIRCWLPGRPDVHLSWRRENGYISDGASDVDGLLTISRVQLSDEGTYYCFTDNIHSGQIVYSPPALIRVQTPAVIEIDPPLQTVSANETAKIRCWLPSKPDVLLTWRKENGQLSENATDKDGVLMLPNVKDTDEGKYICFTGDVYPGRILYSAPATIHVHYPDVLEVDPLLQEVNLNESAQIRCQLANRPYATLRWRRRDGDVSQHATVTSGLLVVPRVNFSDAGEYFCYTDDIHPGHPIFSAPAVVRVKYPDVLVIDPPVQAVITNETALIKCTLPGRPSATVRWRKQDGTLNENATDFDGLLTIQRVTHSDAGIYICFTNDVHPGHTMSSPPARIIVENPKEPQVEPKVQTVTTGQSVEIRCWIPGRPLNTLRWRKEGGVLNENAIDEDGILMIPNVNISDKGSYICYTNDIHPGHTHQSEAALIHVQFPNIPQINPPQQTVTVNETAQIYCRLPGQPHITLRWRKEDGSYINGNAIDEDGVLTIPNVNTSDEGNYICYTNDIHPGHTHQSAPARILVYDPAVLQIDPPQQIVTINETAHIRCWLPGRSYVTLRWRKQDGEISDKAIDEDGFLTIPNITAFDEGTYICYTNDLHPGYTISSSPALIRVHKSIVLQVEPIQQTVIVNQTFQLHCWLPERPYATLGWRKESGDLNAKATDSNGVLTVPEASLSDEGNYLCWTEDEHPGHPVYSVMARVNVQNPKEPQIDPPAQAVNVNGTAQVRCWLPGEPYATLRWSKEGVQTPQVEPSVQTVTVNDTAQVYCSLDGYPYATLRWRKEDGVMSDIAVDEGGVLTIPHVNISDEGKYVCYTNDVHPAEIPQVDPHQQTVALNQTAQIDCFLPGRPYATLQWRKEDGSISDKAVDKGGILTIPNVNISDEGTYVCFTDDVHPGHTISSAPALVHVQMPEVPEIDPSQQTLTVNETAQLYCWLPGRPHVTLQWRRQGGDLNDNAIDKDGILTIPNVKISDEGTYVCFTDDVHPGHTISSAPALVHVQKPDVLLIDPPYQTVTVDETAQVQCNAPDRPYVTLRWRKQDGVINENATDIG
ncbi:unnamed protein product, partial [Anisakis simplex]|uniref:Hemicentin-1 (inferred by orthology to a human protein) n=1 Tax=Anisakis simplex TaxID=6269 RepID=A0A0M3K6Z4_ANISI